MAGWGFSLESLKSKVQEAGDLGYAQCVKVAPTILPLVVRLR